MGPSALHPSAHVDSFARDNLPPRALWPEFRFDEALRYPARLNCAVALLDAMVARGFGEREAIVTPKRRLSYAGLLAEVNRIAWVLRDDLHLVAGNRVLIRGYNDATTAALWLATVKAGCIAVTTMPMLRAKELAEIITSARINAAVCDARLAGELESAGERCAVPFARALFGTSEPDGLEARMRRRRDAFEGVATASDDVCTIAFTSGTTGKPKGTAHFHRDVLAVCDTFAAAHVRAVPQDRFCGTPPLAFTFGLGGLLLFPLRAGASTLLLETSAPETLLGAIDEYRATVCFAAPVAYRAMAALRNRFDLGSLRTCVSAGEALPIATRSAWQDATGLRLIDGIGSTEMLHVFIAASGDAIRPGATGMTVPGYIAAVLDDEGCELGPGTVGHLAVKGPTGCRYLADDRQRDYVRFGWNITGDAYLRDEEGYFWFQSRTDDMIVSAGYNIAGPEIESALLAHPSVAECAVVGIPDAERGALVTAFVVLQPGERADETTVRTLQDFVKATIAPYKYPRRVHFVGALPRTESGKLQRFKLRASAVVSA
jgi:2-aminobenzoate-CoA ligase